MRNHAAQTPPGAAPCRIPAVVPGAGAAGTGRWGGGGCPSGGGWGDREGPGGLPGRWLPSRQGDLRLSAWGWWWLDAVQGGAKETRRGPREGSVLGRQVSGGRKARWGRVWKLQKRRTGGQVTPAERPWSEGRLVGPGYFPVHRHLPQPAPHPRPNPFPKPPKSRKRPRLLRAPSQPRGSFRMTPRVARQTATRLQRPRGWVERTEPGGQLRQPEGCIQRDRDRDLEEEGRSSEGGGGTETQTDREPGRGWRRIPIIKESRRQKLNRTTSACISSPCRGLQGSVWSDSNCFLHLLLSPPTLPRCL